MHPIPNQGDLNGSRTCMKPSFRFGLPVSMAFLAWTPVSQKRLSVFRPSSPTTAFTQLALLAIYRIGNGLPSSLAFSLPNWVMVSRDG